MHDYNQHRPHHLATELLSTYWRQFIEVLTSFSIDKQRGQVNAEWISRPVDPVRKSTNHQPLALVLISMERSLTFADRLKRKLLSGPIIAGAYTVSPSTNCKKVTAEDCGPAGIHSCLVTIGETNYESFLDAGCTIKKQDTEPVSGELN
jgi:hypothetical protein